jgi:response regulator RpfG family c-di-GMP phosphodiesterase
MTEPLREARVMIVDDEPANVRLLERMLEGWGCRSVVGLSESSRALDVFVEFEPDIVLLDLHMPSPDGYELLAALPRATGESSYVPILVLTAETAQPARQRALALGASDFVTKPFDSTEVRLRVANFLETRRLHREALEHTDHLERRVELRTRELAQSRVEALERLALAAEYRDDDTQEHAKRIGRTATLLAERLGVPSDDRERLARAAPLHDLGKIAIPDAILLKPGKLTEQEFEAMKEHAAIGARILGGSRSGLLGMAEEIARTHHERWDGTGYPMGLRGDEIPLAGRIVAVADVFDALTHARPYKSAWQIDRAVAEIVAQSGLHFDPRVVDAFIELDHPSLLSPLSTRASAELQPTLDLSLLPTPR